MLKDSSGNGILRVLLLAIPVLAGPAAWGDEKGEPLLPGQSIESSIAPGETRVYRVQGTEDPVLVTVEQSGIDVVVEVRGAAAAGPFRVDAPYVRWGPEVLVLGEAGEHRIEVRPARRAAVAGSFSIRVEALPAGTGEEGRRTEALAAMSRASELLSRERPEELRQALSVYREALAEWRSLGERRWEAETVHAIAAVEQQLGQLPAAAGGYGEARALWRELSEPRREATVLSLLGQIHGRAGNLEASREVLEEALALWRSLGERLEEAWVRVDLCLLQQIGGDLQPARGCFEEILPLQRELGNRIGEATVLNNLGGVYDSLGDPDVALDHYEQAFALRRELGLRSDEAQTLINMAVLHRALGDWQEALRLYGQAREILATFGTRAQQADLLNNVSFLYNDLGEPQRALPLLKEALEIRGETGDRRGEIIALNNLGLVWRNLGDLDKALDQHREALKRATALGDPRQKAMSQLRLGEVYVERGDPAAALRELEPSLDYMGKTGDRRRELEALHLRGRALALAGRSSESLPVFQEVLARHRSLRNRAGEAEALHALAVVERSLGLVKEARAHAEEAMARVEELRTGFVSLDLRAAFLATRRRAYALVIDLLMDRHAADPAGGHDRAALEISERARARSLIDALNPGAARRSGSSVPVELIEKRRSLRHRLSVKAHQQLQRLGQGGTGAAKAEALGRESEVLLAEIDGVEAEIRRRDPEYAAFSQPQPIGAGEIAGLLDPGTLLLEYSLGEDRSFLWVIGPGSIRSFVLPPQREIEDLARQVYEELRTVEPGTARPEAAAEKLGRILLGPVWSGVAQVSRLAVVPDGALHSLPFSALPVPDPGQGWDRPGRKPLLEHQEVIYLPSATTLALQRKRLEKRPPAPQWAAVLADPVFTPDDPRLTGRSTSTQTASLTRDRAKGGEDVGPLPVFERLPSSRDEADEIAALVPAGPAWTALGLEASREAALSEKIRSYRVVHFATHGIADTRSPELSGLVLSLVDAAGRPREGFLGLSDVYDLELAADLVVLSGCQTALGKEVRGEGLMGLTRGFQYAGVPRVVASLWRVQDRATAELMSRFYRALWRDGLSPAAALREAQRSLRREPRYRDPYSWAGFVLQGDWRWPK